MPRRSRSRPRPTGAAAPRALAAALALLALLAFPPGAGADERYVDPQGRFQLVLPRGWRALELDGATPELLLTAAAGPRDVLVVARMAGPTDADDAELARSVGRALGGRVLAARGRKVGRQRLRALDLTVRCTREGRAVTLHARLLLRRASTTALLVEARSPRAARRIARSFLPGP